MGPVWAWGASAAAVTARHAVRLLTPRDHVQRERTSRRLWSLRDDGASASSRFEVRLNIAAEQRLLEESDGAGKTGSVLACAGQTRQDRRRPRSPRDGARGGPEEEQGGAFLALAECRGRRRDLERGAPRCGGNAKGRKAPTSADGIARRGRVVGIPEERLRLDLSIALGSRLLTGTILRDVHARNGRRLAALLRRPL